VPLLAVLVTFALIAHGCVGSYAALALTHPIRRPQAIDGLAHLNQ